MRKVNFKPRNMAAKASGLAAVFMLVFACTAIMSSCKPEDPAPAPVPVISITTQPTAPTGLTEGSIAGSLTVAASVTEGAKLVYQWYSNTTASNTGGTKIDGAATASYTLPATLTEGTYYYFCEVGAEGAAAVRTAAVTVAVGAAPVISITTQPTAPTGLTAGSVEGSLTVAASVTGSAKLIYQWYSNTTASNEGGTKIDGATSASYTLPATLAEGTYYYFCEITAEAADAVRTAVVAVTVGALPAVVTSDARSITSSSATLGGNITAAGAPPYTSRGVVYSTSRNPTTDNMRQQVEGSGTGTFSTTVTHLSSDTRYYARAYVVHATGTIYGNEINFLTDIAVPDPEPLVFTYGAAFDIPPSTVDTDIADIDVATGVSGGTKPYTFTAAGLPAGIAISAAGVISGTPTTATAAGTATITVKDATTPIPQSRSIAIAYGAVAAKPLTYSISVSPATLNFGTEEVGYTFAHIRWLPNVTITNTGTGEVTLSRPTPVKYNVSRNSSMLWLPIEKIVIPAGESVKILVRYNGGLTVGQHDETITFTTNEGATASIEARLTVTEAAVDKGTTGQLTWKLYGDGSLNITGVGDMPDYTDNSDSSPWFKHRGAVKTVVIGSGVKTIGDGAFFNCDALTEIVIPNNVTKIGRWAFNDCDVLASISIGTGVKIIGNLAFYNCDALTEIVIPNNVTTLGEDYAFGLCSALESVTIGTGVTTIADRTFYGCTALKNITIPDGVTSIGKGAFNECSALTEIFIPDGVTDIKESAFNDCSALEKVTLGERIVYIRDNAFRYCTALAKVTCLAIKPPVLFSNNFTANTVDTLYVPSGSLAKYEDLWNDEFTYIVAIP